MAKKRRYTHRTKETRLEDWKTQLQRLLDATRIRELKIANLRDKIAQSQPPEENPAAPNDVTPVTPDVPVGR